MTKSSLTIIFLLASLTSTILTQDCNNPLLAIYDLQGLDAPESGANLPFCAGLQATDTCCSADTVSSFQDRLNDLVNDLNNYAAGRDLYLAQLRNSYLDRFNDILEDIREDHQGDLQTVRQRNATIADELENIITNARQLSNDSRTVNNQFVANLDEYQRARSECFTTALEVQSSAWCLACNPNYANEGVNADGVVTFSEGLCQAISDACSPYFNQSADFNPLFAARAAYWNLSAVGRYLNNHSTNGVLNAFNIPQDPYNPLDTQEPVTVPEAWTAGQCQDLWSGDAQLAGLLNIGANEEAAAPEEDAAARLLQDGGVWAPDLTATGLDFSGVRLDAGDYFGASDYSDYFNQNQNQNVWDPTDNNNNDLTDNNDRTDNDDNDRTDNDDNNDRTDNDDNNDRTDNDD